MNKNIIRGIFAVALVVCFLIQPIGGDYDKYNVNWRLPYNITGYVLHINGTGIENAYVQNNVTTETNYSSISGYYILSGIEDNSVLVTTSKTGYITNSITVNADGNLTLYNQNITLSEMVYAPNITSWWNNYTSDNSTNFTIPHEDENNRTVFFNVTADQEIDYWVWYVDGELYQNSSSDNITKTWDEGGDKTVSIYGINANGQTNTLTWNIEIEFTSYEYEKLIYEQNLLLLEENEMIGQTMLFAILLIIAFVSLAVGYLSPNSQFKIFGAAFSSLLFIILAYAIIGNQFGEKLQMAWLATLLVALGIVQTIYTLLTVISLLYMMFVSKGQAGMNNIPFDPYDGKW